MKSILLIFAFISASSLVAKAEDYECKITDTDTDADLDSAGVNSKCGESNLGPWACYCKVTEQCRSTSGGPVQTYHRSVFLGCGSLGDCGFSTAYGRTCSSMEQ